MKSERFEALSPTKRRRFLQAMAGVLAAPFIPTRLRDDAFDMVGEARAATPTNFIEINLRDQWDHGHLMVAPSLAGHSNLIRGENGRKCALFYQMNELVQRPNNVFLTPQSLALDPHLDNIAMIDCCELSRGAIHGHEGANALRSPGRSYQQEGGKMPMFQNDPVSNFPQGCEEFYSTTPTPASIHNFVQRQDDPTLRNGFAFKGVGRSIHTCYHFAASLPGAELDRIQSKNSLFEAFPETVQDLNVLPSEEEAAALAEILGKVDDRYLAKRFGDAAITDHLTNVEAAQTLLYSNATRTVSLPLTPEEEQFWGDGVPDQVSSNPKAQIWEQVAYAYKVIEAGMTRSVALEFDYLDVHDYRTPEQMETMTLQVALSLSRLITKLKEAGIWGNTLIAIYCTDGGRSPAANSSGNEGKNTVILAGGMINGGYYGDVGVDGNDQDGHRYFYQAPSVQNGTPEAPVTNDDNRLSGAHVWRTVAKATDIPDELVSQFPDVAGAQPLSWLLKS